jgi:hypothetical protein
MPREARLVSYKLGTHFSGKLRPAQAGMTQRDWIRVADGGVFAARRMIWTSLDEQYRYRGVGRESIRQHTAGGARTDKHIVKSRH